MKRSTLELLCCPNCQVALSLRDERCDLTVDEGYMFCSRCEQSFIIKNGVVHFIDPQELEGINRRFARSYNWFSAVYTLFTKVAFLPFGGECKARKEILDRLELSGGRILEVSIGPGVNLPYLFESQSVGEVYGLDISAGQLVRCNNFVTKRGWSVDLFLGMAEALPFKAETFDSVFHIGGINFFSGKKEAIYEMIRVTRPGSKIVIADESERVAQLIARIPGFSSSYQGKKVDTSMPVHLVPDTMEETRVNGIWKAHGQYHGYCLEFRKPV
jgi:ubiquinone/menaquinone biosynthesis C-methylase UbiE